MPSQSLQLYQGVHIAGNLGILCPVNLCGYVRENIMQAASGCIQNPTVNSTRRLPAQSPHVKNGENTSIPFAQLLCKLKNGPRSADLDQV